MVIRYFGNKQALFAAAIDVDLALPNLADISKTRRGAALVAHFVDRWEGDIGDDALVMLLRSAVANEEAATRLKTVFAKQVRGMLAPVVAKSEIDHRAGLVSSQMLGLALTRYILRFPAVAALTRQELIEDLGPTLQRYIGGKLPR